MMIKRLNRSPGFWHRFGRTLLFLYAVLILGFSLAGAVMLPDYVRSHSKEFMPNINWTQEQMRAGLEQLGWSEMIPAYVDLGRGLIMMLVSVGLGLLLLWRRQPSLFTFYLAFTYFSFSIGGTLYVPLFAIVPYLQSVTAFFSAAGWQFYFIVFFFFPNGSPVPGWTRWLAMAWLGFIMVQPFLGRQLFTKYTWIFVLLVLSALLSQIYRYFWHSDAVQRQQTKWIIGLIILYIIFIGAVAPFSFQPPKGENLGFSLFLAFVILVIINSLFALYPITVTIAIFRYRLWDIDLVIRRTLVYTILTALLGLVYLGLVTLMQALFVGISQQQSPLALVISTLVIAALFNPLRKRIQQIIDRRFFRQRYDAASALDRFSQNLRSQVELAAIQRELAAVVSETIQPASLSLWIRKSVWQQKASK